MKKLLFLFVIISIFSCKNIANQPSGETTSTNQETTTANISSHNEDQEAVDKEEEVKTPEQTVQKEVLEGYVALAYPLDIIIPDGYEEKLKALKANNLEVSSMSNPTAKKGMLITKDGIRLSIEASEIQSGNISLTFAVVDDQNIAQGNSPEIYISGQTLDPSSGIISNNGQLTIKDNSIVVVQKFTKDDNSTTTETDRLKITPEGIVE